MNAVKETTKEEHCYICRKTIVFTLNSGGEWECKEGYYRYFALCACRDCGDDRIHMVKS